MNKICFFQCGEKLLWSTFGGGKFQSVITTTDTTNRLADETCEHDYERYQDLYKYFVTSRDYYRYHDIVKSSSHLNNSAGPFITMVGFVENSRQRGQ